ncbi:MAG TPA: amidohydrolase, partial [Pseudomonas sp.]|nr:amidohydrolase [Pseudomonas sp.]
LQPGCRADFVVFDAPSAAAVVAQLSAPRMGFKAGRQTFERGAAQLLRAELSEPAQRLA